MELDSMSNQGLLNLRGQLGHAIEGNGSIGINTVDRVALNQHNAGVPPMLWDDLALSFSDGIGPERTRTSIIFFPCGASRASGSSGMVPPLDDRSVGRIREMVSAPSPSPGCALSLTPPAGLGAPWALARRPAPGPRPASRCRCRLGLWAPWSFSPPHSPVGAEGLERRTNGYRNRPLSVKRPRRLQFLELAWIREPPEGRLLKDAESVLKVGGII